MIPIKVPPLGEAIVEATIARWLKKAGDPVAQGETLVELETDKITVEVPAFKSGILAKRTREEGDVVKVDEELGVLDEAGVGASAPSPVRRCRRHRGRARSRRLRRRHRGRARQRLRR